MKNKYKTNSKESSKKYKELNNLSTTKPNQSSQLHQIELGGDKGVFSNNNTSIKDKEILVEEEEGTQHYNCNSSSTISPRNYLIKTENFEIWTTSTTKCVSYHGLPYYSIYNPTNDAMNLYIMLNKQGQFELKSNDHEEFQLDSFITKINSLTDSNILTKLTNKYQLIQLLTLIMYIAVFSYLSIFSFYFFYCLIMLMLGSPPLFSAGNIVLGILCIINIVILLILLQVSKILEEKKACASFRHFQLRKNNIQNEINDWNLKTFSIVNMKATLAENFDYIHIKYNVQRNQ